MWPHSLIFKEIRECLKAFLKPMRILLCSLVLFILIVGTPAFTIAQEGHHISIMGGGQLTRINNRSDYDGRSRVDEDVGEEEISPESTYNPALRLRYTYNFEPNYGFQTGIIYSVAGQSYAGLIADTDWAIRSVSITGHA